MKPIDLSKVASTGERRQADIVAAGLALSGAVEQGAHLSLMLAECFGNPRTLARAHALDLQLIEVARAAQTAREAIRPLIIVREAA